MSELPGGDGTDFWRGVLTTGGFTALPRWVGGHTDREAVAVEYESVSAATLAAARRVAADLGVPLSAVLLAAYAKVHAALTGEREVATGYRSDRAAGPLPCRLFAADGAWRDLVVAANGYVTGAARHGDFPVDGLAPELGVTGPLFDTVLDVTGTEPPEPAEPSAPAEAPEAPEWSEPSGTALWIRVEQHAGELSLRLRHRADVLDAAHAQRIAGYYATALALLAADPDAEHQRQSVLSHAELRWQFAGLAGPRRELPDRRFHELFEERVRAHPQAVAAVHGELSWTYDELNRRANRIGRALLAAGLGPEDVVAVVTERNLHWMAAVIAIFKAGGAYLPIEPHFPADRIATTLARSGCRFALTEAGSTATLDAALAVTPGVHAMDARELAADPQHAAGDLGVAVGRDQLAYIYFTSGSTGEPKGAMCEHAGMLNHLLAKIEDLAIGADAVVAQTAPQCFDISLWQLVSALLVGGRTRIVEQDVILDVERFVRRIRTGRVTVLQVVPSYLDVVLSYLERQPGQLPDLRCVSATGEALKKELVQRWFAVCPGIKLVNAYGLTETSDDTNHEVMDRAPDGDRVPLGRPVNNVHVYVVDGNLSPVPLGAPGEIVFSGVCVGRGYVNDAERTRLAFMTDPHRPGQRLYRSGDFGRWLPDGRLEFLGRRDAQVKIRGFRIEIGEIENQLLKVPGVGDGAVVVSERADRSKHLVAFYTAADAMPAEPIRAALAATLPDYMVPAALHWRRSLPLTANGKVDKKALTRLAGELAPADGDHLVPQTPTERRLAAAWAEVLGLPVDQIGRTDHFFDKGGSSLSAVRLAVKLDRAVSLKELTRYPVLAELAKLVDRSAGADPALLQPLSELDGPVLAALVCFPYAGGNAVNFQPLARALSGSGIAVYAVELPGHDVARDREPFAGLADVAERVVGELRRLRPPATMLWGHSCGAALAVETARRLEHRGHPVQHVFLAAQLLGDPGDRGRQLAELSSRSDAALATSLAVGGGYTELSALDASRAEHVGAAYRHDRVAAHRYFIDAHRTPPAPRLGAVVNAVVAADDPDTAGYLPHYQDWAVLAERVELHEVADGGHYFLRTRPAAAAEVVRRAAALVTDASPI